MSEELEPREEDRTPIKAPRINCDEAQARKIMEDIGMGVLSKTGEKDNGAEARPPGLSDLIKLGAFVEGSGVVPLDHGAILVTRQVLLRQLIRLEALAQQTVGFEGQKEITFAMGFLGGHIGKISTIGIKTKVAAEVAAEELRKKRQPSWEPGVAVNAHPGSTVFVSATAEKGLGLPEA